MSDTFSGSASPDLAATLSSVVDALAKVSGAIGGIQSATNESLAATKAGLESLSKVGARMASAMGKFAAGEGPAVESVADINKPLQATINKVIKNQQKNTLKGIAESIRDAAGLAVKAGNLDYSGSRAISTNQMLSLFQETAGMLKKSGPDAYVASLSTVNQSLMRTMAAAHPDLAQLSRNVEGSREKFLSAVRLDMDQVRKYYDEHPVMRRGVFGRQVFTGRIEDRAKGVREAYTLDPNALYGPDVEEDLMAKRGMELLKLGKGGVGIEEYDEYKKRVTSVLTLETAINKKMDERVSAMKFFGASHGKKGFDFDDTVLRERYNEELRGKAIAQARAELTTEANNAREAAELGPAPTKWQAFREHLDSLGYRFITLSYLTAKFSTVLQNVMNSTVGLAMNAQTAMGKIQALLPGTLRETTAEAEGMRTELYQIAQDLAVPFEKVAEGAYDVVSAFPEAANKIALIETAARMAKAGVTTTTNTIKQLVSTAKAFGDESQPMIDWISNVAVSTVRIGVIEMNELSSAMQRVVPAAANFGVSMEEAYAGVGALSNVTGSPQQAATQMRALITSMANPTKALKGLYAQEGVGSAEEFIAKSGGLAGAVKKISDAAKAAGGNIQAFTGRKEAMLAVVGLAGGAMESYDRILQANYNSVTSLADANRKATQGIAFWATEYTQAQERVKQTMTKVGDAMLPIKTLGLDVQNIFLKVAANPVVGYLGVMLGAFVSLSSVFGALLGYASLMISVSDKMMKSTAMMKFITGPWMILIMAITAAAVAGIAALINVTKKARAEARDALQEPYRVSLEVAGVEFGKALQARNLTGMEEAVNKLQKETEEIFARAREGSKPTTIVNPLTGKKETYSISKLSENELKALMDQYEENQKVLASMRARMAKPVGFTVDDLEGEEKDKMDETFQNWRNKWEELLKKKEQLGKGQIEYFNFQEEANDLISSFYGEARKISVEQFIDLQSLVNKVTEITGRGVDEMAASLSRIARATEVARREATLLAGITATDPAGARMSAIEAELRKLAEETTLADSYVELQATALRNEWESLLPASERNKLLGEALDLERERIKHMERIKILSDSSASLDERWTAAKGTKSLESITSSWESYMGLLKETGVGVRPLLEPDETGRYSDFASTVWMRFGMKKNPDGTRDYSSAIKQINIAMSNELASATDDFLRSLGFFVADLSEFEKLAPHGTRTDDARAMGLAYAGTTRKAVSDYQKNSGIREFDERIADEYRNLSRESMGALTDAQSGFNSAVDRVTELMRMAANPDNAKLIPAINEAIAYQEKLAAHYAALSRLGLTGSGDADTTAVENFMTTGVGSSIVNNLAGWGSGLISRGSDLLQVAGMGGKGTDSWLGRAADAARGGLASAAGGALSAIGGGLAGVFMKLMSSSESLMKIMSPLATIVGKAFEIISPVVDAVLAPLVGILNILGMVLGTLLVPVIQMLEPIIRVVVEVFVLWFNVMRPVFELMFDAFTVLGNVVEGISGLLMYAILGVYDGLAAFINAIIPGPGPMPRVSSEQWNSAAGMMGAWNNLLAGTEGSTFQAISYDEVAAAGADASSGGSSAGSDVSVTKAPDQYFQFFIGTDVVTGLDGKVVSLEYIVEQFKIAMAESEALAARA